MNFDSFNKTSLDSLARFQPPDYEKLVQEAYKAWMEKSCFRGSYPDTSRFDYCIAPAMAKERGVSWDQVLYEFYREPTVAANDNNYNDDLKAQLSMNNYYSFTYSFANIQPKPDVVEVKEEIPTKFHFKGYRPNYFDGFDEPPKLEFEKVEELFEMEWVKRFSKREDFSGYALGLHQKLYNGQPTQHILIATYKDGGEWWVIGYLGDGAQHLGIPIWEAHKPGLVPSKE